MNSESTPTCAICVQPITPTERWEYWRIGSDEVGTPIHTTCKTMLVRQVMQDIHAKPDYGDRRNERSD